MFTDGTLLVITQTRMKGVNDMKDFSFTVNTIPIGKGRPRFRRCGRAVITYTPAKTHKFEQLIADVYKRSGGVLITGPIKLEVIAYMPIPKSRSKKEKTLLKLETTPHTNKPDGDNILKAVCDGLNGIAYPDDKYLYSVSITKLYSESPRLEIRLLQVEEKEEEEENEKERAS